MKNIFNVSRQDRNTLIIAFLASFITFWYSLSNFTMSIDNEGGDLFYQKIGIGRFGGAFLKEIILPTPYSPFFTTFIMIVFITLAFFLASKYLSLNSNISLLFCVLGVTFPAMFYQADFHIQSDTVGIGFFCAVLSTILFSHALEKPKSKLIVITCFFMAVFLLTFSISIYQSLFFVAPCLFCMYVAISMMHSEYKLK